MSKLLKAFQELAVIPLSIILSTVLISCSGEEGSERIKYDHAHAKSTDMKKHLFEHEFAQQCIANEMAESWSKEAGRELVAEQCMCKAIYLFKDLAAKESYELLNDKKQAQSLRKKYQEAAKHCV